MLAVEIIVKMSCRASSMWKKALEDRCHQMLKEGIASAIGYSWVSLLLLVHFF